MAKKQSENYLDYVPVISEKNTWSEENGTVTVHMVHRGVYAAIAQKVFHRPRVSHIALDETGSFIYGIACAEDFGGSITKDRIDLYMPTHNECIQFGRQECTVYFLG